MAGSWPLGPSPTAPVSQCEDLEGQLQEGRRQEPVELAVALEILECCPESIFGRPISLENAIERRPIPGLVPGGRAQRFVDNGHPVGAEGLQHRAAVSVVPKIRCEKLLDCTLVPGAEIDRKRHRDPLYF